MNRCLGWVASLRARPERTGRPNPLKENHAHDKTRTCRSSVASRGNWGPPTVCDLRDAPRSRAACRAVAWRRRKRRDLPHPCTSVVEQSSAGRGIERNVDIPLAQSRPEATGMSPFRFMAGWSNARTRGHFPSFTVFFSFALFTAASTISWPMRLILMLTGPCNGLSLSRQ
jgi:hypothetical protein